MTIRTVLKTAFAGVLVVLLSGCMSPQGATSADKRQEAGEMRADTLAKLYRLHPEAKTQIATAEGYGVFSNVGINLVLLSAGNGWGIVRNNATGRDIYMKMVSAGIGVGLGVKDFRGVFVFTSRDALRRFTAQGWDANAQADAAAKSGEKGDAYAGAIHVAPASSSTRSPSTVSPCRRPSRARNTGATRN